MIRLLAVMLMVGLFGLTGVAAVRVGAEPSDRTVTEPVALADSRAASTAARSEPRGNRGSSTGSVTGLYRNHSSAYWAWRFRVRTRQLQAARARLLDVRRTLLTRPSVTEAINLAGATYGNTGLLWSLARCETGGTFNPGSKNPSSDASGLLQFMPSTFASTPYRGLSLWSPYASAMAGGWMLAHGRRGEWVC